MKLDPDPELVRQIRQLKRQGQTFAEILRFLVARKLNDTELMVQVMDAFQLTLGDVKCIDGWFPDGVNELNDEAVNRILNDRLAEREKEQAA